MTITYNNCEKGNVNISSYVIYVIYVIYMIYVKNFNVGIHIKNPLMLS